MFMHEVRKFFRDNPYLFWVCLDGVFQICVSKVRMMIISENVARSKLVVTMKVHRLWIKYFNMVSITSPSINMHMTMLGLMTNVKETEYFMQP